MINSSENPIIENNHPPFKITILTLYPEAFPGYLNLGVVGRALKKGIWSLEIINIRDYALDKYKKVDDKVFGGGKGLLLKPDVLGRAIESAFENGATKNLIYPSPRGAVFNQEIAKNLSQEQGLTFVCGHFEGIDERIIEKYKPQELSLGDYILSGGELATTVIIDSILRLKQDVLNSKECTIEESFNNDLLEYPQYTHPQNWEGMSVPEVLLSGNHQKIKQWRFEKSLEKTQKVRPDLFEKYLKNKHIHKNN
ncbi:MAG: tRNA (guanosine(37)-N1)-methyltransferase TrmD [Alphaproteobacteria bacterium]|jgi:tRNA (guanine37-N1)-methyltransferase|nr:tRNA (guanosine(37)-N1)-methyltransferase TrmD [Alphaproteobacteria bacterium]